jgi:hypothetical protein
VPGAQASSIDAAMPWALSRSAQEEAPSVGDPLPRAAAAGGVREKLAGYSLNAGS